jgi:putative ABC transport system permease protein
MKILNLCTLAAKYVARNRTRSFLTIAGVATGMFLFATIETMQESLKEATVVTANDTTLVVYRENRFCPATSRLPEYYKEDIERIDGVTGVLPMQIVVNNCGTSLDVVVFRGILKQQITILSENIIFEEGSIDQWLAREDGALVGTNLAQRRRLKTGDTFDAAGITVTVAGIIQSAESSQDDNVAFVHLPFLQQASRIGLGVVTQFTVKVRDSSLLDSVSQEIDQLFKPASEPTRTTTEKAFFANTAKELIELIHFSRWIGVASVLAVIALLANTILITVRGKVAELAVLKTLGYSRIAIAWLIISEGLILSTTGGIVGVLAATFFLHLQSITIGNEGLALAFIPSFSVWVTGLALSIVLGILAGLYPAWQASKNSIAQNLRTS